MLRERPITKYKDFDENSSKDTRTNKKKIMEKRLLFESNEKTFRKVSINKTIVYLYYIIRKKCKKKK